MMTTKVQQDNCIKRHYIIKKKKREYTKYLSFCYRIVNEAQKQAVSTTSTRIAKQLVKDGQYAEQESKG